MNKLKILSVIAIFTLFTACNKKNEKQENMSVISEKALVSAKDQLVEKHGKEHLFRIEKGVKQVSQFWTLEDGTEEDFIKFCVENFKIDTDLDVLFSSLERNFETIFGLFNRMNVSLMEPIHVVGEELTEIDMMFGSYAPSAHLTEDFFQNKIAFVVLLNFPNYSLEEKNKLGVDWTDRQWAFARVGDLYDSRVPAQLVQEMSKISTETEAYISEYNVYMGNLRDNNNNALFPANLKLNSHWGLRDEIKSQYAQKDGLEKQRMIFQVMNRIVNQEIPEKVINNNQFLWNPLSNIVKTLDGKQVEFKAEPNTRYLHLQKNFVAVKNTDKYYPYYPTYIERKFEGDMQMLQSDVENLFIEFVSSEEIRLLGKLISKRLGRNLEPFDIWYDGFKSRSEIGEDKLDEIVRTKYPDALAFEKAMPDILKKMNFPAKEADFIASKIKVDDSRGSGHAWGAAMKDDKARLRTRVGEGGMNYKGFNIAMHELGHNVEQTNTLHDVSYYFLNGVPNTAFTEAIAFMFQKRDMLIINKPISNENLIALDRAWSLYEIMGVSLVDMNLWKWLYANPNATEEEIKNATIEISKDIWNKYYADVFGVKDQTILAIYSHMINYPLYLSAYPIGFLIEFQLEEAVKGKPFGQEMIRVFKSGNLTPEVWMKRNTGSLLSNKYLLNFVRNAVKTM